MKYYTKVNANWSEARIWNGVMYAQCCAAVKDHRSAVRAMEEVSGQVGASKSGLLGDTKHLMGHLLMRVRGEGSNE